MKKTHKYRYKKRIKRTIKRKNKKKEICLVMEEHQFKISFFMNKILFRKKNKLVHEIKVFLKDNYLIEV